MKDLARNNAGKNARRVIAFWISSEVLLRQLGPDPQQPQDYWSTRLTLSDDRVYFSTPRSARRKAMVAS